MINIICESKIIITIDTEVGEKAKSISDGFTKFIEGRINNEHYGVYKIIEILDSYNFKAEFFVDVYESKVFGEYNFELLCKNIKNSGHGVQLHTHPSYAYSNEKTNMHQYSLEEQIKIIRDGKNLIKKWIAQEPIAHRAGNYGADNNTLQALNCNGIRIDSSYFHNHPNCKIQLKTINEPVLLNNVLEIPITVFRRGLEIFNFQLPLLKNWYKLDINYLSLKHLKKAVAYFNKKLKYIILFLHSSSFILRDPPYHRNLKPDTATLEKFNKLLDFIKKMDINCILFREILSNFQTFF
ncbi:MAG: polysaccharide deacetylase family protein [Candidatus Odinarchaeum yellowstonii]|uniref:Polysaccharide deacetylase family protein n=1 Tax=Odinarchaeota yellowstonii (strain LCB_4) TaxID=1841599 RepID=A0AAF0D4H9_ODILC|nr:MAG: polysaccharide deacetylase family protein [Candidatus Odinarchaeum yellowstonii]